MAVFGMMAQLTTVQSRCLLVGRHMGTIITTNVMYTVKRQVAWSSDQQSGLMRLLMRSPQTKWDWAIDYQVARSKRCLTSLATLPSAIDYSVDWVSVTVIGKIRTKCGHQLCENSWKIVGFLGMTTMKGLFEVERCIIWLYINITSLRQNSQEKMRLEHVKATTHDHKALAKTPLRMKGCNFNMSVDKRPQSHCLVAILLCDLLGATIDHFRKAENRSAENTDPSYHFLFKKWKFVIWALQLIRVSDLPAVSYRACNVLFAGTISSERGYQNCSFIFAW